MQTIGIKVRNIEIGTGIPKICVPIVARTREDILEMLNSVLAKKPDCIELRIDWFEEVMEWEKVLELLREIRERIGNTVLLFTFRTGNEGGEKDISSEDYKVLCENACQSGYIDMVDVEAFKEEGLLAAICEIAHANGVYVVASNHDFGKTPAEADLVERLQFMEQAGADIPKIAVMPQNTRDVITLLSATLRYRENGGEKPVITMSMGGVGAISRLSSEIFGSAVTFAAVGKTSAPGQITIEEVRQTMDILHRNQ